MIKNAILKEKGLLRAVLIAVIATANVLACHSAYRHGVPEGTPRPDYALLITHPDITVKAIDGKTPDIARRTQEIQFQEGNYELKVRYFSDVHINHIGKNETLTVELMAGKQYFLCPDYKKNRIEEIIGVSIYLLEDNEFQSPRLTNYPRSNVPEKCRKY